MNDLISRSRLKEELKSWAWIITKPQYYHREDADFVIDCQAAVKAEPAWVPVSERLPQEDEPETAYCDTVQVLLKSGEVTVGWCNRYFGLWYHLPIGETYFVDADYEHTPVVAWKPLAEPPKECE